MPPLDAAEARRLIDGLSVRPLLDGERGQPPADVARLAAQLARSSVMVADLGSLMAEIDVNPVLAAAPGARRARCAGRARSRRQN